jgi:hypothetical protein
VRGLIALSFLALLSTSASAHSWYPENCCNNRDCELIPLEAVTETLNGWHVEYDSPIHGRVSVNVPRDSHRVKPNEHDGQFHGCFYTPRGDTIEPGPLEVRCFWYPLWF